MNYVDDAFYASQKEPEIRKKLTVRNGEGKGLSFLITLSKSEPWKRKGRERAGEAPCSPNPPTNGYYAVGVDVRPLAAKPRHSRGLGMPDGAWPAPPSHCPALKQAQDRHAAEAAVTKEKPCRPFK